VHALVPAVLFGMGGFDQLGVDAEADPPDRQQREAAQRGGGERHTVVGADDPRQTVRFEDALKGRAGQGDGGGSQALTGQEVPAVAVHQRQWIAVFPSRVLNCPLKSAVQMALGAVIG